MRLQPIISCLGILLVAAILWFPAKAYAIELADIPAMPAPEPMDEAKFNELTKLINILP